MLPARAFLPYSRNGNVAYLIRKIKNMSKTIIGYITKAIKENWNRMAFSDFHGVTYQYSDVARKIAKLHILFRETGIQKGDKIAFCGKNSSQWATAFLASLTYGAVPVPLLHEFKPDNLHHLVNHCEARLFFVDHTIWENLDPQKLENLYGALLLSDYSLLLSRKAELKYAREHLNELCGKAYPERFTSNDVKYDEVQPDDLAVINYTSGSMGFSKGVMVPYRALASNMQYAIEHLTFLLKGDGMVCMLPLAHMFGLSIEMLHPFIKGCHIHFLTRVPSPKIIMEAFAIVRPKLIITVPLVVEKIIKGKVFPMLEKPMMKFLLKVPFVDQKLYAKIKERITQVFGGQLQELIVGGAALNADVDEFMRRIGFPITVGYGMTECAPLISYAPWNENKSGACGRIVDRMEMHIESSDPETVPGELWVKGENVMLGYFHNQEATDGVMKDGWMNTGDLCQCDSTGLLYIRGRSKNMILGPSGQNIYPEEIEMRVNNLPFVNESLVIDEGGKLVALIYPDFDTAAQNGVEESDVENFMRVQVTSLNKDLPAFCQLRDVKIHNEEFEKTPKRSIKRFLYQH